MIWIGKKCNDPRNVAAVLLPEDLLLIDIKGHSTPGSYNSYLILMTQTSMNISMISCVEKMRSCRNYDGKNDEYKKRSQPRESQENNQTKPNGIEYPLSVLYVPLSAAAGYTYNPRELGQLVFRPEGQHGFNLCSPIPR